jgi:hypothetical protein
MNKFKLTINGAPFEWPTQEITGHELRKLAVIDSDSTLYYRVQGKDEEIHDTEKVDLGRIGIEHFYSESNDPVFKLEINGEPYSWSSHYITGVQLRELGKIAKDDALYLNEEQNDLLIPNDMRVDLAPNGKEKFYSKIVNHLVKIYVTVKGKTKTVEISKGRHTVQEIKQKGDVPSAFELEQKINGKLVPLDDNGSVEICGNEEFVGHVRDGSSS